VARFLVRTFSGHGDAKQEREERQFKVKVVLFAERLTVFSVAEAH
jgi:hypothetical protein